MKPKTARKVADLDCRIFKHRDAVFHVWQYDDTLPGRSETGVYMEDKVKCLLVEYVEGGGTRGAIEPNRNGQYVISGAGTELIGAAHDPWTALITLCDFLIDMVSRDKLSEDLAAFFDTLDKKEQS